MARAAAPTGSQSQAPGRDRGRVSKQQIAGEKQEGPEPCISLSSLTMFVCGVCRVHACVWGGGAGREGDRENGCDMQQECALQRLPLVQVSVLSFAVCPWARCLSSLSSVSSFIKWGYLVSVQ